jgi:hypothetical protein
MGWLEALSAWRVRVSPMAMSTRRARGDASGDGEGETVAPAPFCWTRRTPVRAPEGTAVAIWVSVQLVIWLTTPPIITLPLN